MCFAYYWYMHVTLSLDAELVKKVRNIAADRGTTLTEMVRGYLETVAAESAAAHRQRREGETLERSFERFRFHVGKRARSRADLYIRS